MRIIAGRWRGRALLAPAGQTTRPTSERLRQAVFDMLLHAPWGGRGWMEGIGVVDAFAGTGALGLEALSRGAGRVDFFEADRAALAALRANILSIGAQALCGVHAGDVRGATMGRPAGLAFLDPPYGQDLVAPALAALAVAGWIDGATVAVVELARGEAAPAFGEILTERTHGAGRVVVGRGCEAIPTRL